ncbi:MAG: hypothetical protein Q8Q14_00760 [Gemmatimonadales bacterium]|nr:hypothetical protein [Gemmatimonadales bacterium]
MTTDAKRYRVTSADVSMPTRWEGARPHPTDPGKIHMQEGDLIPKDVARRARESKIAIDALPEQTIRSLIVNGFVEELT